MRVPSAARMVPESLASIEREHLSTAELALFARGALGAAEGRLLVRHLLARCQVCRATARALWVCGTDPLIPVPRPRTHEAR